MYMSVLFQVIGAYQQPGHRLARYQRLLHMLIRIRHRILRHRAPVLKSALSVFGTCYLLSAPDSAYSRQVVGLSCPATCLNNGGRSSSPLTGARENVFVVYHTRRNGLHLSP